MKGSFIAVGAGPSADLITLRGIAALQKADIILYDRLTDEKLLTGIDCEKVFVGKTAYRCSIQQEEINTMLEESLKAGKTVVRLKGGDSVIFSRLLEELSIARAAGAQVEVIPGVTAASAAAAQIETALTDRVSTSGVTFITGHPKSGELPNYDWHAIVANNFTIVVYMGGKNIDKIRQKLISAGMRRDMPMLAAVNIGGDQEKYLMGTVSELTVENIATPVVFIIGEVLKHANIKAPTGLTNAASINAAPTGCGQDRRQTSEACFATECRRPEPQGGFIPPRIKGRVCSEGRTPERNLYMLGVGPGDPELVTIKAVRLMQDADIVYVPESAKSGRSVAEIIAAPYVPKDRMRMCFFPMTNDITELDKVYMALAEEIAQELQVGKKIVYITLGDSMIYSTAQYLAQRLKRLGAELEFVPGVPSYVAAANQVGVSLADKGESFVVTGIPDNLPEIKYICESHSTVVFMKIAKHLKILQEYVRMYKPHYAVLVKRVTLDGEEIYDLTTANPADDAGYLAIAVIRQ